MEPPDCIVGLAEAAAPRKEACWRLGAGLVPCGAITGGVGVGAIGAGTLGVTGLRKDI